MTTYKKDAKSKKEVEAERELPLDKPALKDLDAEPDKADLVRGGPASCRTPAGC